MTGDEISEAMRRYQAGEKVRKIAEDYGVSAAAISQMARRRGIASSRYTAFVQRRTAAIKAANEKRKAAEEEKAREREAKLPTPIGYMRTASEIIRLHKLGRSRSEIAALLRLPYRQIESAISLSQ